MRKINSNSQSLGRGFYRADLEIHVGDLEKEEENVRASLDIIRDAESYRTQSYFEFSLIEGVARGHPHVVRYGPALETFL